MKCDRHGVDDNPQPEQRGRSGDGNQPAVRRERRAHRHPVTAAGAGFGVATNYQNPRTVQAQVRFSF